MTDPDIYWTFQTAMQFGGGFYQALAKAGVKADSSNKQRIIKAFPELYATYGPASRLHRQARQLIA
jgi:hypothetical protein